eukprot:3977021-Amphidinium_carterae.1
MPQGRQCLVEVQYLRQQLVELRGQRRQPEQLIAVEWQVGQLQQWKEAAPRGVQESLMRMIKRHTSSSGWMT